MDAVDTEDLALPAQQTQDQKENPVSVIITIIGMLENTFVNTLTAQQAQALKPMTMAPTHADATTRTKSGVDHHVSAEMDVVDTEDHALPAQQTQDPKEKSAFVITIITGMPKNILVNSLTVQQVQPFKPMTMVATHADATTQTKSGVDHHVSAEMDVVDMEDHALPAQQTQDPKEKSAFVITIITGMLENTFANF
jgi:hypothetical protein